MGVEDYFMRQINQLGNVLGKILVELLKLKNRSNIDESIEFINQQLTTALKIDIDAIIEIPLNEFIETFEKDYEASFSNFEDLAELLYQVAHLYTVHNDKPYSAALFSRAKRIYKHLLYNGKTFSIEYNQRIEEIEAILNIQNH